MKISIVVPTYNEENDIEGTLDALVNLDYANKEIIIVDDSTDSTREKVERYSSQGVHLIYPGGGGRSEARNIGIRAASGEVICILNADVRLPRDFLSRIVEHYQKGADIVLVASKVSNTDSLLPRFIDCCALKNHALPPDKDWPLWTEGYSCRRELALKTDLFPTGYPVPISAGEDVKFTKELLKLGAKKKVDMSICVLHVAPSSYKEFWMIRKNRGIGSTTYHRYLNRFSLIKITLRNLVKISFFIVQVGTLFYPIIYCYNISRYSRYGRLDTLALCWGWLLDKIAFHVGACEAIFTIYKKEKFLRKKIQDNKDIL